MSITTHDGTNHNGLFDVLGVAFYALAGLNTARGTTVPNEVLAVLSQFAKVSPSTLNADDVAGLGDAISSWQSSGSSLAAQLATTCQNVLVSFVQADTTTVDPTNLEANLEYLIDQMAAGGTTGGDHVSANTPGITSPTPVPGGNAGDLALVMDTTQADGTAGQNALAEVIAFTITSSAATTAPAIVANSPANVGDRTAWNWPGGSGLSALGITLTDPAASLLTNGQFETDTVANLPDDWIPAVATPGTTLTVTAACVQTLTIAGTPTGGTYIITWEDQSSVTWGTAPLAYNATASQVQAALNAIPALANATVSTTGTSPNYTHTISFTGIGGAVNTVSYVSFLTGGSPTITPAVVTAADSNSYNGQSLVVTGNGSELTTLYQALPALDANTVYFLHFRSNVPVAPAAGALKVSITQGIGTTAATDAAGNSGSATITLSSVGSGWKSNHFSFRLSAAMPQPCYLKVALTTALSSGKTLYLDDFALAEGQQLYSGGPYVAAFEGRAASAIADSWSYTITNTWSNSGAAGMQTFFNEVFGMADLDLLLPTSGSTLITDSLIT